MNIDNELLAGRYLKAAQFSDGPAVLRISNVKREVMTDAESKLVIYFSNSKQGLVLNKTNGRIIRDMYGPETSKWAGKPIQVYATTCEFGHRTVDCIRVRASDELEDADGQLSF